jgi:Protein of unknown function (DUF2948)
VSGAPKNGGPNSGGPETAGWAPLRLRALDGDDLQTIAACLQDALVPLSEIAFLKADRRFVMVANRFRWERTPTKVAPAPAPGTDARFAEDADEISGADEDGGELFERVNCGVCFDRVRAVRFKGMDVRRKSQILNLLTLQSRPDAITLVFAGGATIRLDISGIRCHLEDLGEPWPTRWQPAHPAADDTPGQT